MSEVGYSHKQDVLPHNQHCYVQADPLPPEGGIEKDETVEPPED